MISNTSRFLIATLIAVILAGSLIVLGRISADGPFNPGHTVPGSTLTPPVTPGSENPSPEPTENIPYGSLPPGSVSKGSPAAPVTMTAFSDFQCYRCQVFALNVEKELDTAYVATGKVYLTYKFMIVSDESLKADEAAACAAEQGQFWPYYYLLMQQKTSPDKPDLPVEKLQALAQQLGLDMEKFNNSLLSGKFEAYIRQNDKEGRDLGMTGTPTFFINGQKLDGAVTLRALQEVIDPWLKGPAE
jgi:protein-disulfide isomerase